MGKDLPIIRRGDRVSIIENIVLRTAHFLSSGRELKPRRSGQHPTYATIVSHRQIVSQGGEGSVPREPKSKEFPCLDPRSRPLTPSPPDQAQNQQAQSRLLNLPPEVLSRIYDEVVGNRTMHIVRRKGRLGHTLCRCNYPGCQEECREEQCRGLKVQTGLYTTHDLGNKSIIPLLQTCKKVYMSAVDSLYKSNTFDLESMETLVYLSVATLPKRFDTIHKLQLDFRFNFSLYFDECTPFNDLQRWERIWRIIASMGSLQHLWVRITWPRTLYPAEERKYLADLSQIVGLETFTVSLPRLKGNEVQKDLNLHVVRRAH